jgi:type III restriction enzyme
VDAYQIGLVKQICVSSNDIDSDFNRPYVRLASVDYKNGFSAKIEIDKLGKDGKVERKLTTIKPNTDLFKLSGDRELYRGCLVAGIDCTSGFEGIEFADGSALALGKSMGDVDENLIKRAQIKRTIEIHLEKELRYNGKGIKVLSLFFVDEVAKYRDADGEKGIYATMFEECYAELLALPKFAALRERFTTAPTEVHDGYFSQDKKGVLKNTKGDTADDYDTYSIIMRDKERLLSFDCPLRFIWSHSALKEGWDNPNVFQVCTLIEQRSVFTCRQKVGRGLRLCVNQDGERIEDRNINILHVIANESFAEFADTLQKEIEQETGIKFGILQSSLFNGITYRKLEKEEKSVSQEEALIVAECTQYILKHLATEPDTIKTAQDAAFAQLMPQNTAPALVPVVEKVVAAARMGAEVTVEKITELSYTETKEVEKTMTDSEANELIDHFEQIGYINKGGVIKEAMKEALATGTLVIPEKFEAVREQVETIIFKANSKVPIHEKSKEVVVRLKKQVIVSPEFLALWDKIKNKTAYRVKISEDMLKSRCLEELAKMEHVPKARIVTRTARVNIEQSGVTHTETSVSATPAKDEAHRLPDFLRAVDNECFLSQKTVVSILSESGRLQDFLNNPQKFTEMFIETIKAIQNKMEIDGIRYIKLDGEEYYLQEIFDSEELIAYLEKNAFPVDNSVYDHVIYQSKDVELPFAKALDEDDDVRMFFKIPPKFKIETPIGTYNPDWAVYLDKDGVEKIYFVIETKGTTQFEGISGNEGSKIKCGIEHFKAVSSGIIFPEKPVRDWREFKLTI